MAEKLLKVGGMDTGRTARPLSTDLSGRLNVNTPAKLGYLGYVVEPYPSGFRGVVASFGLPVYQSSQINTGSNYSYFVEVNRLLYAIGLNKVLEINRYGTVLREFSYSGDKGNGVYLPLGAVVKGEFLYLLADKGGDLNMVKLSTKSGTKSSEEVIKENSLVRGGNDPTTADAMLKKNRALKYGSETVVVGEGALYFLDDNLGLSREILLASSIVDLRGSFIHGDKLYASSRGVGTWVIDLISGAQSMATGSSLNFYDVVHASEGKYLLSSRGFFLELDTDTDEITPHEIAGAERLRNNSFVFAVKVGGGFIAKTANRWASSAPWDVMPSDGVLVRITEDFKITYTIDSTENSIIRDAGGALCLIQINEVIASGTDLDLRGYLVV